MNQMMMNLAINAAHAMGKDGGVLDVSLKKENLDETAAQNVGLPKGSYLKLTVSDTGSGMTPSVMARMYEPYFTTNKKGGSTGMGLSIVHGIVKRHMGAITCRSDIGKGTVFEIYLPEVVAPAGGAKAYNGEKALQAGNERILFVDDEPDIAALAKAMLEDLGCRVTAKTSSMEALELFKKDPDKFDLVITDMTMPGMTGDRLAQKILEVKADMPVIMCTGYSEYITEKRAKSIGIREYMMKPLEMEKLVRIIRKVLGEHQAIN
ncbi:MAG TPA: response regulator [Desulfomonilia bacterium]|nr:response regulator [Desulfomonilia bacterium]